MSTITLFLVTLCVALGLASSAAAQVCEARAQAAYDLELAACQASQPPASACSWLEVTRTVSDRFRTSTFCMNGAGYIERVTYTVTQRNNCSGAIRNDEFEVNECVPAGDGNSCPVQTSCHGACTWVHSGLYAELCQNYTCAGQPIGNTFWRDCPR